MLRLSRETQKVGHIQKALYHWRAVPGSAAAVVDAKPYALQAGFRALAEHVQARYGDHAWVEDGLLPGTFRVRRKVSGQSRVSVLILCRGGGGFRWWITWWTVFCAAPRIGISRSLSSTTASFPRRKRRGSRRWACGWRIYPGKVVPFNYAAKANFAIRICRTENLVILNDDMEVIDENWLTQPAGAEPGAGDRGGRRAPAARGWIHSACWVRNRHMWRQRASLSLVSRRL
ncbi:MAG: hypothetical protein WDN04_20335 [Rhodospirillales bacterium]